MIPNIFHFIYYYREKIKEFPLSHYLCVNSARMLNNPDKIYFYSNEKPSGLYWEKLENYVEFVAAEPPDTVFDRKLYHIAHKSDVQRIRLLKETGGIYLDMDVICKKSFASLLNHEFVLGKQGKYRKMGLCNGVILADKKSEFLRLWLEEFKNFRSKGHDKYWSEMSVRKPYELSKKYPELIHVEPYDSFHYPLYYPTSLRKLFVKCRDYPAAYCHHVWEAGSWDRYLSKLNEDDIKNIDTTYNIIARKFL